MALSSEETYTASRMKTKQCFQLANVDLQCTEYFDPTREEHILVYYKEEWTTIKHLRP